MLIEQIAEREILGIITDGHRGHDLLAVEKDRERALDRHAGGNARAGLIDTFDALGQARVGWVGANEIIVVLHAANVGDAGLGGKRVDKGRGAESS